MTVGDHVIDQNDSGNMYKQLFQLFSQEILELISRKNWSTYNKEDSLFFKEG